MKETNTKLTLSINKKILKSIKEISLKQGWILSKKVENFFASILQNQKKRRK